MSVGKRFEKPRKEQIPQKLIRKGTQDDSVGALKFQPSGKVIETELLERDRYSISPLNLSVFLSVCVSANVCVRKSNAK